MQAEVCSSQEGLEATGCRTDGAGTMKINEIKVGVGE